MAAEPGGGQRTLLVCVNVDCEERGSPDVVAAFLQRREAGDLPDFDVREYICFSACEKGPNVVCVEDQIWYCGVEPDDVDEIVSSLRSGETVERLIRGTDKITRNLIFSILDAGLLPGDV